MFDENEVRKTISVLKPDGQLFEVRIIGNKVTYSGYFKNADTLVAGLKKIIG